MVVDSSVRVSAISHEWKATVLSDLNSHGRLCVVKCIWIVESDNVCTFAVLCEIPCAPQKGGN